jgi:SAM-dependent methyltransferase
VLDVGGTRDAKRGRFNTDPFGLRLISVNITDARRPDVVADGAALPLRPGVFDAVICSEVMEHVPEPDRLLEEAHRVLRTGGVLLMCVPFLHRLHGDPEDYGRYTDQYWREHLTQCGFEIQQIEKQGGFWAVLSDMLTVAVTRGIQTGSPFTEIIGKVTPVIGDVRKAALVEDAMPADGAENVLKDYTTGFGIVATKQ